MGFSNIKGDVHFEGKLTMSEIVLPSDSVANGQVDDNDPLDAEKVEYQYIIRYGQSEAAANIDETEVVHICRSVGEVVAVEACQSVVATGATGVENTTVKIVKQTGATTDEIMTADIQLDLGNSPYVPENGTLDGTGKILANNDVLKVVVTQNGTLGTPIARGLCVNITLRETPPGT